VAVAIVDLMQSTFELIHPLEIIKAFNTAKEAGDKPAAVADDLWDKFGDHTIQVIANGCRMLAHIWEAAWAAGDGDTNIGGLEEISQDDLVALYTNHEFVPSFTLDRIKPVLQNPAGPHAPITRTSDGIAAHRRRAPAAADRAPRTVHGTRVAAQRARAARERH
jgi:hypothetical protein